MNASLNPYRGPGFLALEREGAVWFVDTLPFHVGLVQAKGKDGCLLHPEFVCIRQGRYVKVRFEAPVEGTLEISEG